MLMPMGRRKLPEVAVAQIKHLIESGEIKPGDKLPTERELTEQLKVSRSSVREALRTLEALGLIEVKPGLGTFVRSAAREVHDGEDSLTFQAEIDDLLEVREILETKACRLAAQRGTPEDLDAMARAIDDMQEALAAGDLAKLVLADMAFHHAITRAARNNLLVRLEAAIAHQLIDCRRVFLSLEGAPIRSIDRHQMILQALKAADGEWAASIMVDHLKAVEASVRSRRSRRQAAEDPAPVGASRSP